jgi:hypothetical protein
VQQASELLTAIYNTLYRLVTQCFDLVIIAATCFGLSSWRHLQGHRISEFLAPSSGTSYFSFSMFVANVSTFWSYKLHASRKETLGS